MESIWQKPCCFLLNSVIIHMPKITCRLGYSLHIHVFCTTKIKFYLICIYMYMCLICYFIIQYIILDIYIVAAKPCSFFLQLLMFFHKHIWPSLNIRVQSQTVTDISVTTFFLGGFKEKEKNNWSYWGLLFNIN